VTSATPRLALKRALSTYYLALCSPGVADPTAAFGSSFGYLSKLLADVGPVAFMDRLDDETTQIAGEVEQDLRRGHPELIECFSMEDVEDRVRECFEYALVRLGPELSGRDAR
jgi:hypothetical protein